MRMLENKKFFNEKLSDESSKGDFFDQELFIFFETNDFFSIHIYKE